MTDLKKLQADMADWQDENFPGAKSWQPLLGIGEEVGELNHAYLKMSQGIRGTLPEHHEAMVDAIGDTMIYLFNFCSMVGIDVEDALQATWAKVSKRDWREHPYDGERTSGRPLPTDPTMLSDVCEQCGSAALRAIGVSEQSDGAALSCTVCGKVTLLGE